MTKRIDDVVACVGRYDLDDMPPPERTLYRLAVAFMEVGFLLERVLRTDRRLVYPLTGIRFLSDGFFDVELQKTEPKRSGAGATSGRT